MRLDVATVLLQWSAGGLLFCWVTTRRLLVGLGYGWLLRATYGLMALGAAAAGRALGQEGTGALVRDLGSLLVAGAAALALGVSVARRRAGVTGQRAVREHRRERVAAMLRRDSGPERPDRGVPAGAPAAGVPEFPPFLDLLAPAAGLAALLGAAAAAGGPYPQSLVRLVVGALFLGVVSDAMLLGHWYLVQPGLSREPIKELVALLALVWPFEVAALLWPTGMLQVFSGEVDDGYQGLLGYTWAVCAVTTIALTGVTWLALRERAYSAVMAATGLLYLAILTAFGTDLVARAVLAP
ncbi:MAG: hypothetical protein M5U14_13620 [Acidimicrobiia bacterium]|nr:hypothetical protein [Acidimicrobiia bacterium]